MCNTHIRGIKETVILSSITRWINAKQLIVTFRCNAEVEIVCRWGAQELDFTGMP